MVVNVYLALQEFLKKCRVGQEYLSSSIPWASSAAERSRQGIVSGDETKEEKLLAELLTANQELLDALQMYDDLERTATDQKKNAERKVGNCPSVQHHLFHL